MFSKTFSQQFAKFLTSILLLCLIVSAMGPGAARALEPGTATPTPEETPTPAATPTVVATEEPTPTLPPLPTLTPTEETLSALDLSSAGTGTWFRARVALQQPRDLARLTEWGITVLDQGEGAAYVRVDQSQLGKLARLGFAPTQIDSIEYMLDAQAAISGNVQSLEDVISDPGAVLSLSSVDTDTDGLTDTEESWWCTNPNDNNSDSPQEPSGTNPDDGTEVFNILRGITAYGPPFALWPQFTPYNPNGTCPDGDFDGVPDYAEEFMIGTSNLRESSDKDKFDDGQELFGVTYCPASSGPCGYGILPRAEDAAFVSANLPAWVKAPGNSPFVAAFPEPEVEVVPSSIVMTQKTTITNTKGTTVGTEKTYGSSSTKGTSTGTTDTTTWNEWQEVSHTTPDLQMQLGPATFAAIVGATAAVMAGIPQGIESSINIGDRFCQNKGNFIGCKAHSWLWGSPLNTGQNISTVTNNYIQGNYPLSQCGINSCSNLTMGIHLPTSAEIIKGQYANLGSQNIVGGNGGQSYFVDNNSQLSIHPQYYGSYPMPVPSTTVSQGKEWGGSHSTTTTQYEEQTISESSTNQYSDNWSIATAVDSTHAADLRFTYNIVNNGTEYAREVTSLTFNVYIGNNPNPAYTYVAVGSTGQIAKIENLFPGDELTYTSDPIALTLDEMRAIDEGASVRVVMEDISFGQDQVFYLDALSGSVLIGMEDGFDDNDELVDTFVIPVWDPSDTLQDVIRRYFPVVEDAEGDLLSIYTPESESSVPSRCEQDSQLAPASYTTVFCKHALTGTSWWNIYLSDGLSYNGVFSDTLAVPNTTVLVRIVSDRDLDGYNDRNEIRLGTDPDDAADHPSPNLIAAYTTSCSGDDCTVRMVFQNLGNYDAYGVEAIMYSPDGLANITNNTIGGSGRVPAGARIVVGPSDTFQYTKSAGSAEPVIVVSYNDPQGNHRFILPSGSYPAGAQINTLDDVFSGLNGLMLLDPGVDISSTSANQAGFVINAPHPTSITNGKLFIEYIDGDGNVLNEDVITQTFDSGPTVVPQTIDLGTYPPATTILLAFFTDSQGNIIDSSARPLASFGVDPAPEANLTITGWEIGVQGLISLPDPWDLGTIAPGTTLHAQLHLTNTGLGDLRYSLTGFGNGWSISGNTAGTLSPTQLRTFDIAFDSAGYSEGPFAKTLTLRTNDPSHGTITINLSGTLGVNPPPIPPAVGAASAYAVGKYHPWDQFVYVEGPLNQNDLVTFTHTLTDDPTRMFPLYLYDENKTTLKGVGEYGVDFSGQTAPFGVFGTGADGDLIITSGQTIYTDNTRSALASTASSGQNGLALSSANGFAAGQEVLVIQVQGTGAGNYEFGTIASVAGNTLTLSKNLTSTYTVGGNSKAQVIRVPQYHDVSIQNGGVLTAHAWDGNTGGVVAFRVSSSITIEAGGMLDASGKGYRGGQSAAAPSRQGWQGENLMGLGIQSQSLYYDGGGGGKPDTAAGDGGGGGGGGSYASSGTDGSYYGGGRNDGPGHGSTYVHGYAELTQLFFGGAGGSGGADDGCYSGVGGSGGGIIAFWARAIQNNGSIHNTGANGGDGGGPCGGSGWNGGGGGGAGGSILIGGQNVVLGNGFVRANEGLGGLQYISTNKGGNGGIGRIRIEYGTLTGTTNPTASTQQVNYYNMTGTNPTSLYMPEAIASGNYIRYSLLYGQRSSNTNGGDQLFSVRLPNRQYSSITLSALNERVGSSGSSFNFCLDFGNDGTCDYTVNNQSFSAPVRLDTANLASALNTYITAQHSAQEYLTIPIRVNISTPADIFLFNLSSSAGNDADLVPTNFTITPPNGNPSSNIPEGSQVTLSAAVTNNGTHKAENFTVAFYNGDPANGGVLVGSTFIAALDGGATSSTQQVTWNTTGLLGDKTLYVKVDTSSSVAESNENNNVASAAAVIKKKADLLITSLTVPDARQGETVTANLSVKNAGEADVTGAVISLYDGTPAAGTLLNSTTVNVAKGATVSAQISFSINTVGAHTLWVKADPADLVLEADETNNTASSSNHIGWNLLTVDAGGAGDSAYDALVGYGWQTATSTASSSCGTDIQQSYRQAGSAETLTYQIDNLLPGRMYHLDLTFATCSGDRWQNVFVEGHSVVETGMPVQPFHVTSTPQTISLLLDPVDYADGAITLAIQRASGLNGPLVNIIDVQEVRYCYRDSGPSEQGWTADNNCGYDSSPVTDGFDGWGTQPPETMRFGESGVNYKFTDLDLAKLYNVRLAFYEGDGVGRSQRILFDGVEAQTITLDSSVQYLVIDLPPSAYADGQVIMSIQRIGGGDAIVNEVTLDEVTRRYPSPSVPATPTPTPTPDPPQVTVNSFTATWSSLQVNLVWSTITEINNHDFKLYRSTDVITWTEIATIPSQVQCGTFTGASPITYTHTDTNVAAGMTYYYRLQASGEGCGAGSSMLPMTAEASPTVNLPSSFGKTLPANSSYNKPYTLTLQWSGSTNAASYQYCYDTTNDNACSAWLDNGSATSRSLSGLKPNTTYYWHVRAVNVAGTTYANDTETVFWSFKTKPRLSLRSAGTRDGWILESTETSNKGGSMNSSSTLRIGDDASNRQYRSILYFNTAGVPDNATITRAVLRIKKVGTVGTDPFSTHGNLVADIRTGYFGIPALELTDFQNTASKLNGGKFTPIVSMPGWYQLVLNTTNRAFINLEGVTQFRLRFTTDDNNDNGADYITCYAGDAAVTANRPLLIIEYTVP